jgi:hypothetical protein
MSGSGRSWPAWGSPVPTQLRSRYLRGGGLPRHLIAIGPGSLATLTQRDYVRVADHSSRNACPFKTVEGPRPGLPYLDWPFHIRKCSGGIKRILAGVSWTVQRNSNTEIPDSSVKPVAQVQLAPARTFRPVVRVASGNFLEMYDFQVFGYYAAAIARTFFPSGNEFASLMFSLMTFGTGFLMRPLGAIVLGTYIDHRGRRNGLLLTLGLMAIGTVSIACTPSYASIGLIAPLLVVAGRRLRLSFRDCDAWT